LGALALNLNVFGPPPESPDAVFEFEIIGSAGALKNAAKNGVNGT
jgi:hypothetical protein